MVIIKTPEQIQLMIAAGKILTACRRELRKLVRPGIMAMQINEFAEDFIVSHWAKGLPRLSLCDLRFSQQ